MPQIDLHPSLAEFDVVLEIEASLRANVLNPKLLYVTPRQTELWREVFLRHSPIHGNPEFTRIYRDAYTRVAAELPTGKFWVVGLGCGTGLKERELCSRLKSNGHEVSFSAIDVSRDLVAEAAQKVSEAGIKSERHLVCDLTEIEFLKQWLARIDTQTPRIFTFFGLVPNMTPAFVVRLFRDILRQVDVVLVSAHLMPVSDDVDPEEAMRKVLPQYDNPETLVWLGSALEEWGLMDRLDAPEMKIGEMEGVPAFIARARWKSSEPFDFRGHRLSPRQEEPLRVFHSLRYTPALFEEVLSREGFRFERLAITACREEGIWSVLL